MLKPRGHFFIDPSCTAYSKKNTWIFIRGVFAWNLPLGICALNLIMSIFNFLVIAQRSSKNHSLSQRVLSGTPCIKDVKIAPVLLGWRWNIIVCYFLTTECCYYFVYWSNCIYLCIIFHSVTNYQLFSLRWLRNENCFFSQGAYPKKKNKFM
jgi:hypothetical protein